MPYKDKEAQKKANKERMALVRRIARDEALALGNTSGNTKQGNTEYPAILKALVDPEKRKKLEKIYQSLSNFKQTENVYYGCRDPIPLDVVGDLLEVTA